MLHHSTGYRINNYFNPFVHINQVLVRVGVRNEDVEAVKALLSTFKLQLIHSQLRRVLNDSEIVDWVDLELVGELATGRLTYTEMIDMTFEGLEDLLEDYIVEEISLGNYDLTRHINHVRIMHHEADTSKMAVYNEPYEYKGLTVKAKPEGEDQVRLLTLHTSKETPLVSMLLTRDYIAPRTAALLYFTPSTVSTDFVFELNGEKLLDVLRNTVSNDRRISVTAIARLFTLEPEYRYLLSLAIAAYIRLNNDISAATLTNMIFNSALYYPLARAIINEKQPAPSDAALNQMFSELLSQTELPF